MLTDKHTMSVHHNVLDMTSYDKEHELKMPKQLSKYVLTDITKFIVEMKVRHVAHGKNSNTPSRRFSELH